MTFGLYDTKEQYILEHGYGSRHGAQEKKSVYGNNHNLYVFEYENNDGFGVVVSKQHKEAIQKDVSSRRIK